MKYFLQVVVIATVVRALRAKICPGMDIRNSPSELEILNDCVVVNGSLHIVLMEHFESQDYADYSFPNLKEISEHLLMFRLKGLTSLQTLFPNLLYVRGRKLFQNKRFMDAVIIYDIPDLVEIGLPNLMRIDRGTVQIGKCPELCYVRTVNWTALGTSLSTYSDIPNCDAKEEYCPECNGHCWAPRKCQRISDNCHPECLGCTKPNSAKDCFACKNWKDGDTCVSQCPSHKLRNENTMICVTEDECNSFKFNSKSYWVFGKTCLLYHTCPEKYQLVTQPIDTCEKCIGPCYKKCKAEPIITKADIKKYKGCTHIEGHLVLNVKDQYAIEHLEHNLIDINEIDGCLKVHRSDALSSLHFLWNLKRIGGVDKQKGCNNHTVYIFENSNLRTLIANLDHIESNGDVSIGFQNNPELCISEIKKFAKVLGISSNTFEEIFQEEKDVSPYTNGDRAQCGDLSLAAKVVDSSPTNVTLEWESYTSDNSTVIAYTVYYIVNRTLQEENNYNYDNTMCNDNGWRSQLASNNSLTVRNLQPYSKYAFWIKVFALKNSRAISKSTEIKYFETIPDDPDPPIDLEIRPISPTSVHLSWESPETTNGQLSHYQLYAFLEQDDSKFINQRDYCVFPHAIDNPIESPKKKEKKWINQTSNGVCFCDLRIFKKDSMCMSPYQENSDDCNNYMYHLIEKPTRIRVKRSDWDSKQVSFAPSKNVIDIKISANSTAYILNNLKPFSKYIFWFSACNVEFKGQQKCSAVLFASTRTNASKNADQVTKPNVRVFNENTVSLTWVDPENPNGMIVAYNIEYNKSVDKNFNVPDCITREQHVRSGYVYRIENMDPGEYTIRVRPVTLYGAGIYSQQVTFQIKTSVKSWLIYLVICFVFAIISSLILFFWYKKKTKAERVYLIPSINPEYSRAVYIEEGWELERDDVEMAEVIGQGSFGVVYNGYIRSMNLPCAVKTMNSTTAAIQRTDFLKEAFVMRSFNDAHHVIKLYGVVSKDDPPLVIMELMERGDLKQYLRNARKNPKAISLPEVYQMAAQIADGMSYLSAKKYVHRDLAARNCMVAGDRTVKIGDFGMTKDIYETDYYRKGTSGLLPVRWMAPESLADGVFSSESDVWSYGIVLWEMVTLAEHPYQGMANEQVLKFVTTRGRLGRPKDCPNVLWEIMEVCWEHKPSKRPLFIGIVEKLDPLAGQSFSLVSFYHSQAGHNYRMNYGRQESIETTAINRTQSSYLREEDVGNLMEDNLEDDEDSLTWPSTYSISSEPQ